MIFHNMSTEQWAIAAKGLIEECETDIGIFLDHDALLLKPIDDLLIKMGEYDLIGPEEIIPFQNLYRYAPGMMCQNFFILNVKKMKEAGLDKIRIRDVNILKKKKYINLESGYGISQTFDKKLFLPVTESGYGHGTYYGDYIHHLWYGSYRKRQIKEIDNVDPMFIDNAVDRLIEDYNNNEISGPNNRL